MSTALRRCVLWLMVCGGAALSEIADAHAQLPQGWSIDGLMLGFHYGVPLKWSGVIAAPLPANFRENKAFIAAEPGIGGWRASVGYVRMTSDLGRGYVARASFLRTNGNAWRTTPRSSFAGTEFQFMPLFAAGVRLGGFIRVGQRSGPRGLFTADLSLML
jgi:hypothetical protein